ncbi:MAG: hypothetical protein GWP59_08750 [Chlamydiales bacterium]|nr:hypothetical protein [Chlamydiales bacterium]NCF71774.1 hypothetical protein [Chlamydiales bacterium]
MGIFGWVKHAANTVAHGVEKAAETTGSAVVTAGKATGTAVVTAGEQTGKGLATAGKAVGKGMATAQNGLTNLMYPDIPGKQREVKELESRYNLQRTALTNQTHLFDQRLAQYQQMVAYNSALLISLSVIHMSDDQFTQFLATVENNAPIISLDSLPAQLADSGKSIAFLAGGVLTLRGIRILGKLSTDPSFTAPLEEVGSEASSDLSSLTVSSIEAGVGESTGEIGAEATGEAAGEMIAETAAEGAAEAGLAETGVGVVIAAGVFAIFSAIQGAEEESKLNKAVDKLNDALNKVDGFLNKVDNALNKINQGILEEETRFVKMMNTFNAIQKAGFTFSYPQSLSSAPSFSAAMLHAVGQYGFVNKARVAWQRMSPRGITWDVFENIMVAQRDPSYITADEAKAFLSIIKSNSASMQKS